MMGKFWGPKPSMTKWIYTNIVRPTFTYGCIAWAKKTRSKDFQNKAKRLQRLALMDIGPIRTHSPTSGLEIFTNVIPLDLYIRGEFISAHCRIRNVITTIAGTRDTISSHYAWAHQLRDEAGIHNIPMDTIMPFFHGNKIYQCTTAQYDCLNETRNNKLQIFTDGSRIKKDDNGYTGCGYVIYGVSANNQPGPSQILYEQAAYLGTMASVFQAEVFAIGMAVHYIVNNREILNAIDAIDIVTDSRSALQAIDGTTTSSKLVMDCMKELDQLQQIVSVKIHWTKAHVGHEGNERADQLAKEGTTKTSFCTEPILPVAKTWVKGKIKHYLHSEWTKRWLGNNEARQTKIFFPEPNGKTSKKLLSYDKQSCAQLFRWICGHSFHRYHNHLLKPETFDDPRCRLCGSDKEETSHLFAFCPALAPVRMKITGRPILEDQFKWQPALLLTMIKEIEKICPEEGMIETLRQLEPGTNNSQLHG
jgi:ribonuclease HI